MSEGRASDVRANAALGWFNLERAENGTVAGRDGGGAKTQPLPPLATPARLRILRSLIAPDAKMLALGVVCLLVTAVSELLVPRFLSRSLYAIGEAAPSLAKHSDIVTALLDPAHAAARSAVSALSLVAFSAAIFSGLRGTFFGFANHRLLRRLRQRLYDNIVNRQVGSATLWVDNEGGGPGAITSRIHGDCTQVSRILSLHFNIALRSVIQVVGGFVVLLATTKSPWLAATCVVLVGMHVFASVTYGTYNRQVAKKQSDVVSRMSRLAESTMGMLRTVRILDAGPYEAARYNRECSKLLRVSNRNIVAHGFYHAYAAFVNQYSKVIALVVGASGLVYSMANPGSAPVSESLTAGVLYIETIVSGAIAFGDQLAALNEASGSLDKVMTWLEQDEEAKAEAASAAPPPPPSSPHLLVPGLGPAACSVDRAAAGGASIAFEKVWFSYDPRSTLLPPGDESVQWALRDVSFDVPAGSVVAIVGASGGGKSTIAGLTYRLMEPVHGTVRLDGVPLGAWDEGTFRSMVCGVDQPPRIVEALSPWANVAYGSLPLLSPLPAGGEGTYDEADRREPVLPPPSADKLQDASVRAGADGFLPSLSPDDALTLADDAPSDTMTRLSAGQVQRVALARMLARDPRVLVLDEATSALDARSEQTIQSTLDALRELDAPPTVLVVAHRLNTIRNADQIVVVADGAVEERGSHDQLMKSPIGTYRRMVDAAKRNDGRMNQSDTEDSDAGGLEDAGVAVNGTASSRASSGCCSPSE